MGSFPGKDYHHQLHVILGVLGTPTIEDYYAIQSRRAREYIRSLPFKKNMPLKVMFPKRPDGALDLLERLLTSTQSSVSMRRMHSNIHICSHTTTRMTSRQPSRCRRRFSHSTRKKNSLNKEQLKRKYSSYQSMESACQHCC